jgi:hypothetical protein
MKNYGLIPWGFFLIGVNGANFVRRSSDIWVTGCSCVEYVTFVSFISRNFISEIKCLLQTTFSLKMEAVHAFETCAAVSCRRKDASSPQNSRYARTLRASRVERYIDLSPVPFSTSPLLVNLPFKSPQKIFKLSEFKARYNRVGLPGISCSIKTYLNSYYSKLFSDKLQNLSRIPLKLPIQPRPTPTPTPTPTPVLSLSDVIKPINLR